MSDNPCPDCHGMKAGERGIPADFRCCHCGGTGVVPDQPDTAEVPMVVVPRELLLRCLDQVEYLGELDDGVFQGRRRDCAALIADLQDALAEPK